MSDDYLCNNCRNPVKNSDDYCVRCGTKLNPRYRYSQTTSPPEFSSNIQKRLTTFLWDLRKIYSDFFYIIWAFFIIVSVLILLKFLGSLSISLLIIFNLVLIIAYLFPSLIVATKPWKINFNIKAIFEKPSSARKVLVAFIICVEIIIFYFVAINSNYYKNYSFRNRVNNYAEEGNKIELVNYFEVVNKYDSDDSTFYMIKASLAMGGNPLSEGVEDSFLKYSDPLKDKILNAYYISKTPLFPVVKVVKDLFECNFQPELLLSRITTTHTNDSLMVFSEQKLINTINLTSNLTSDEFLDLSSFYIDQHRRADGSLLINKITGFLSYFNSNSDSIWRQVIYQIQTLDSLRTYHKNSRNEKPYKPSLIPVEFSPPVYLRGGVVPYNGTGLLVTDFSRYYVVRGADRYPGYFEGYVTITNETEIVVNYNNNSRWDATICIYRTQSEYEELVEEYNEALRSNYKEYKAALVIYQKEMQEYQTFQKVAPIINSKVKFGLADLQKLLLKIEEKNKIQANLL